GVREPPQPECARPIPFSGSPAFQDPTRAHLRVPERPRGVHPELLLPRRAIRLGQTPGSLGRGHGLRPRPTGGDASRSRGAEGETGPASIVNRGRRTYKATALRTQPASCLSNFPLWISFDRSFASFPSTVTPIETQVPTTSRTRAFRVFARVASAFMFVIRADVGGVPTSMEKVFVFGSTSRVTGTFIPSNDFVFSLIALRISTMFTPSGPSAGPRGGPGVALPPSTRTWSFSTMDRPPGVSQ